MNNKQDKKIFHVIANIEGHDKELQHYIDALKENMKKMKFTEGKEHTSEIKSIKIKKCNL